jgi:DNA (cytosine-5)-methyltransferase 1
MKEDHDDRPTVGSLFSGIGGFDVAFERAGFRVAWQVEWDEACRRVLGRRFGGDTLTFADVRDVGADTLPRVDVLVGGWPCQPVSVAGKRRASSDERDMWPEFARIARELAPAWVVGENVPGVLTAEGGSYWSRVVDDLDGLGYGVAWRTLDARHFGVPQRRRRVFVVGCLGDLERPAEVLFEPEGVRGDPASGGAEEQEATADPSGIPRISNPLGSNQTGGFRFDLDNAGAFIPEISPPVVSKWAKGGGPSGDETQNLVRAFRKATKAGGDKDWERWEEDDLIDTLDASGQAARTATAITIPIDVRNASRSDPATGVGTPGTGVGEDGDPSGSLSTNGAVGAVAFNIYPSHGQGADLEASETDEATGIGRTGLGAQTERGTRVDDSGAMAVRRLMPIECERLQGFPDGWTEGQADSTRYRQLGNAVAVPVVFWIARRLRDAIERGREDQSSAQDAVGDRERETQS